MKNDIKIVYMGTTEFSSVVLRNLIENKWNIVGVVCQCDKPVGRKKQIEYPMTKKVAMEYGIEVFQPVSIRNDYNWIIQKNPDLIVTCAYGQIVPQAVLDIPRLKCINVHGSLLPKYRGAAPIQYSILKDEKKTGVTIMEMVKKMDAGKMFAKAEIDISNEDTSDSLFKKMEIVASNLLLSILPKYINGEIVGEEQDEQLVSFAPSIKREEEIINWSDTRRNIYNKVRAFNSVPGAYTLLDDTPIKIWTVEEVFKEYEGKCGEIVEVLKDRFIVKVSDGAVAIKELQVSGKKRVFARDYLNGNKELKGKIFHE